MSLLRELNALGALRTLDDALANTLRRLDPSTPDAVLAAAALASLAVANGHAAFDVAQPRLLVDADSLLDPCGAGHFRGVSPHGASGHAARTAQHHPGHRPDRHCY